MGLGIFASAAARREFETSAGSYYKEFSQMRDNDGNPMPEDMARLAAYAGGLMNSGIEVWEYMGLGKIAGAGATLAGKAGGGRSALESRRGEPVGQGVV